MICKYFGTPGGCARGANCFYAHGESELRRGMHGKLQKHRVFVGGLPLSMDAGKKSSRILFCVGVISNGFDKQI